MRADLVRSIPRALPWVAALPALVHPEHGLALAHGPDLADHLARALADLVQARAEHHLRLRPDARSALHREDAAAASNSIPRRRKAR
jgi:hypothetical protein